MFEPIETVNFGLDLTGNWILVPRYGTITVAEHIALADVELSLKKLFDEKGLVSQRELDYRTALEFYRLRAGVSDNFETLSKRLTFTQAQKLGEFLQEELAGIPDAEVDDESIPQSQLASENNIQKSTGDSATGSQVNSQKNNLDDKN